MWADLKKWLKKISRWAKRVMIALDQLCNAIAKGWPDETFSSRCWRGAERKNRLWCVLRCVVDFLFFWEKDHCRLSYESERERRHLPVEMREEI